MSTSTEDTGSGDKNLSEDQLDKVAGGAFELNVQPSTATGELQEDSFCSGLPDAHASLQ